MGYLLALILAGVVGVCVALEPTINAGLGRIITPRLAALHSFITGMVIILLVNIFSGGFKEYRQITKAPLYLWFGGLIGATVVYVGARVVPVIGLASTLTIMVAVQMITSLVIDSLGLFGTSRVPLDMTRVIGVILIIIAVRLIVRNPVQ